MAKYLGDRKHGNTWEALSNAVSLSTTAYDAGDLMGGLLTFSDVVEADFGGGKIVDAIIYDSSTTASALDLVLFNDSLGTGTSATGDNGAFDLADTDMFKMCANIPLSTGNDRFLADNQIHTNTDPSKSFFLMGKSMYGVIVCQGTPTYSSGNTLQAKIVIERDA